MPDVNIPSVDQLLTVIQALAPLIRTHADEAERNRRLSPVVVRALAEAGLFRMYTPRTLGGFEVDPLTFYRVVEAIARIDGSTGWCVFIAGGNPLLGAFLADEAAEKVFGNDPQVITAGVVHPYGTAILSHGGYRVTGRWSYASGCQHASWVFCCCQVFDGDQKCLTDDGEPDVRLFFVPSEHITIVETWDVSGLAGTGSHDVVIDQVFVPAAYTCAFKPGITPQGGCYRSPVYRYVLYASFALAIGAVTGDCPGGGGRVSGAGTIEKAERWDGDVARSPTVPSPYRGGGGAGALGPGLVAHGGPADLAIAPRQWARHL